MENYGKKSMPNLPGEKYGSGLADHGIFHKFTRQQCMVERGKQTQAICGVL
jgi:hypothetical protein